MATVTRARRAQIQREARDIRARGQRAGHLVERIAAEIRTEVPEVTAMEAWRLALGWSRAETIRQVGNEYLADGLMAPGLSEPQLCRMEHGDEQPGPEYQVMLARAFGARIEQLGLTTRCHVCNSSYHQPGSRYGRTQGAPELEGATAMTTASGMPAVRESLQLALLDAPAGNAVVVELARSAVEHYALNYSKHPPALLLDEVRATRRMLADVVTSGPDSETGLGLRQQIGWLSALLGNLAHHLGDITGARSHLTLAVDLGTRTHEPHLAAWASGALAMVATSREDYQRALGHATTGLEHAPEGIRRAQLLGWAQLPALAGLGDADMVDQVLAEADAILETAGELPGRFGYDLAEHRLHAAEANLTLRRWERAAEIAEASIAVKTPYTPGWAAATLVLALAEAQDRPADAALRALDVLDRIPAARLRSTSRSRLTRLDRRLAGVDAGPVRDLAERLRVLPPPINEDGTATA